MMSHPHHAKVSPKFCKRYADVGHTIQDALTKYREEVTSRTFPGTAYSPYKISQQEVHSLIHQLEAEGMPDVAEAVRHSAHQHVS